MGIQDKNTKNSIKSKNYHESETLGSSKNFTLIHWYIVIKPSVPCSGRKRLSEKMSKLASTTNTQIESSKTKSFVNRPETELIS